MKKKQIDVQEPVWKRYYKEILKRLIWDASENLDLNFKMLRGIQRMPTKLFEEHLCIIFYI